VNDTGLLYYFQLCVVHFVIISCDHEMSVVLSDIIESADCWTRPNGWMNWMAAFAWSEWNCPKTNQWIISYRELECTGI